MGTITKDFLRMNNLLFSNEEKCKYGAAADLLYLCSDPASQYLASNLSYMALKSAPKLRENECLVSIEKLAARWRWGSEKTRRFLKYLEELHLVELRYSPGKGTYIRLLDPDQAE